jgi:hypothetical protein
MLLKSTAQRYWNVVGLGGLEPPTSRLSSVRSNQLSYKPIFHFSFGITKTESNFDQSLIIAILFCDVTFKTNVEFPKCIFIHEENEIMPL